MNEIHKAVLLKHAPDLKGALVITESFLGDLYHKGIFEEEMLDMIRVCQLPSDKICKLIELLPKRDPEWFDSLMEILEKQYNWLAKKMKDSVVTENEKLTSLQLQTQPTVAEKAETVNLKKKCSIFLQKEFRNSKRFCEQDKKRIEKFLYEVHGNDVGKIDKLKEECQTLYEKTKDLNTLRENLEQDLQEKENELRIIASELSESRKENTQFENQVEELKAKCVKLEKIHMKYAEKQQTLMTLKHLVKEMQISSSHIQDTDKQIPKTDRVRLPKIHHGHHEPKGPSHRGMHRKGNRPATVAPITRTRGIRTNR